MEDRGQPTLHGGDKSAGGRNGPRVAPVDALLRSGEHPEAPEDPGSGFRLQEIMVIRVVQGWG